MSLIRYVLLIGLIIRFPLLVSCQTETGNSEDCSIDFILNDPGALCGTLRVPENRSDPSTKTIPIKYVVLKAVGENPKPDPIVFLQGGPGAGSIFMYSFFKRHSLNIQRDIILIDQRGTGFSHTYCDDLGSELFEIVGKNYSVMDEVKASEKLAKLCKEETKKKKIDLSAYRTRENAADIEAVREELGYRTWNLLGGSYGSRLALELMKNYPESIRSVMLLGPFPPNADMYGNVIPNFKNSLTRLIDQCIQEGKCESDLLDNYYQKLEELIGKPLTVNYKGNDFVINPQDATLLVHQYLYQKSTIEKTPDLIRAIVEGDGYGIYPALQTVESRFQYINLGMYMAVQSNEEIPFGGLDTYGKSIATHPEFKNGIAMFNSDVHVFPNWTESDPEPSDNQAVKSDIPTLVIAGEFDPITPHIFGKLTVETLSNAYLTELKGEGHVLFGNCFDHLARIFLENPENEPEYLCQPNPIEFN